MGPVIHLLGTPRVQRDGAAKAVLRGHKAWGLLAYLVQHPEGVSRQRLAALLFEDAEDPLAALRWNLSELRRALGDVGLGGDVVVLPMERTPMSTSTWWRAATGRRRSRCQAWARTCWTG